MCTSLTRKSQLWYSPTWFNRFVITLHYIFRRTLRSWLKTAKQLATVCWTWDRMLRSASMKIPRSRTIVDGMMSCDPILNAERGSWCWRRAVAHQSSSILLVFNWRRLDDIQLCTSSMHADRRCWRSCIAGGLVEPHIWVSSAYADEDRNHVAQPAQ